VYSDRNGTYLNSHGGDDASNSSNSENIGTHSRSSALGGLGRTGLASLGGLGGCLGGGRVVLGPIICQYGSTLSGGIRTYLVEV
jgi:hypothetical protein